MLKIDDRDSVIKCRRRKPMVYGSNDNTFISVVHEALLPNITFYLIKNSFNNHLLCLPLATTSRNHDYEDKYTLEVIMNNAEVVNLNMT